MKKEHIDYIPKSMEPGGSWPERAGHREHLDEVDISVLSCSAVQTHKKGKKLKQNSYVILDCWRAPRNSGSSSSQDIAVNGIAL